MMDLKKGFYVGGRRFAWGTPLAQAADELSVPPHVGGGSRWRRLEVACGSTYGLDTISAELSAPRDGRPVTGLKYELAAVDGETLPDPTCWLDRLTSALGDASRVMHHELPAGGNPQGSVRFHAHWSAGEHSLELSIYGAPREVAFGIAAGCIWVSWAAEAAAEPFVGEYLNRAAALVPEAEVHSGIVSYTLSIPGSPALGTAAHNDLKVRASFYALEAPHLLATPPAIARQLGRHGFAFWRSGDYRRWYASTQWETVVFELGAPVEVEVYDIKPAKGGGFAEIAVDEWRVRDRHGSRAIDEAVSALRTIPGVKLRCIDGYDS